MLHEPDKFKNILNQTIIRAIILNHNDIVNSYEGFFTMCARDDHYYKLITDYAPPERDGHVVMWDLLKRKFCVVDYIDIGVWTYYYKAIPKVDENNTIIHNPESGDVEEEFIVDKERALNHFKLICDELHECECCDTVDCCHDELVDVVCNVRTDTINEQLITWRTLKFFDFKCKTIEQLCCCEHSGDMQQLQESYMNKIRKYRVFAFEELDKKYIELEQNNGDAQQLQHIEAMRQQLRDIPQVTDLTQYSTIMKLVNFWPDILGERPDEWCIEMESCVLAGDSVLDLVDEQCTKACCEHREHHDHHDRHESDPLLDNILTNCADLSGLIEYRDKCLAVEELTEEEYYITQTNPMYMDTLSGFEFIVPKHIIDDIDKRIIFLKDQNQTNK